MYSNIFSILIVTVQVSLTPESLDHTHVFILDAGKEIYIWSGGKSKLNERSKARLISERINKLERKGKAQINMFRAVSGVIVHVHVFMLYK